MEQETATATVAGWVDHLAALGRDLSDPERIDLIRSLEQLKAAASAAQARVAADFDTSQREAQEAAGTPARRVGRGIPEQVALARRESPHRGARHLGVAKALSGEMPWTLAALTDGRISEWRATLLVRETAILSREDRAAVDEELAGPDGLRGLEAMSDREVVAAAQRIAYRLDAHSVAARARRAESERTVTLRPAPDTMSYLTGLLPVAQGVACLAVLTRAADAARAVGDPRTRGQVMADTLVAALGVAGEARRQQERPLTWADADTTAPASGQTDAPVPDVAPAATAVSLSLVMTDRSLLAGDDEPAHLLGYGTVPASWARDLLRDTDGDVWVRRLYTHPSTGDLLAADSRSRFFRHSLRQVLVARDQRCRTPWCDAPVRQVDHVIAHMAGGRTDQVNGQATCQRCNLAKSTVGWSASGSSPPGDRHTVTTTTPTGHDYVSRAPALPGASHAPPRRGSLSRAEFHFGRLTLAS